MKSAVERRLNEVRAQLRALPLTYNAGSNTDGRQKLLVTATQDVSPLPPQIKSNQIISFCNTPITSL